MSAVTIRPAVAEDLDALLELIHAAYRGTGGEDGWTTEAQLIDGPRTTRELLAADLADPATTMLVAGAHDGCAAVTHRVGGRAGASGATGGRVGASGATGGRVGASGATGGCLASFGMFAVRPAGQGAGLGGALLGAAEDHARAGGAVTMEMCVIDVRDELIAWYERRGYRRTGRSEPFPYGAPGVGDPRSPDLRFAVLSKRLDGVDVAQ